MAVADLAEIQGFLACPTPESWIEWALENQSLLLIDHAHCEKKAASTALSLMYRYPDRPRLLHKMSRLAREELRHFEQVLAIMGRRGVEYRHLSPSGYAGKLRGPVRGQDPGRLVDMLIVGAFIEARSCERFACLAPHLDQELADFYQSLLRSEARHYRDYLALAADAGNGDIEDRVATFRSLERTLVESADVEFRFHSGASTSSGS